MKNKLKELKEKTKLKFFKNIGNYYDKRNISMDEDTFSKNAQGFSKNYHEVLLLMKCLHTKPQLKNMNNNYYDLFYTVIENGDDEKIVDNQYENDYVFVNDIVIPNHKPRETILK